MATMATTGAWTASANPSTWLAASPVSVQTFTTDFMGYAIEWSPFDRTRLAVSCSENFGLIGRSKQYVLSTTAAGAAVHVVNVLDLDQSIFDCSWSEVNAKHLALACGDGSVKLWDCDANRVLCDWREHTAEVYSVDWNLVHKEHIVSGAWDNSIRVWHPDRPHTSVRTYREHTKCIYATVWHPRQADVFASASGDHTIKLWDMNESHTAATLTIHAHDYEILTCDWSKYDDNVLVTGSVDKTVRVWDVRAPRSPTAVLEGHEFAVRRVKCSPHHASWIASASYDMSTVVWDLEEAQGGGGSAAAAAGAAGAAGASSTAPSGARAAQGTGANVIYRDEGHTEFVLGVDWSLFDETLLATCAWDCTVRIQRVPMELATRTSTRRRHTAAQAMRGSNSSSSSSSNRR